MGMDFPFLPAGKKEKFYSNDNDRFVDPRLRVFQLRVISSVSDSFIALSRATRQRYFRPIISSPPPRVPIFRHSVAAG